ncbi:hypothetical protein BWQ96_03851 [Gracilariopsis chorda]|uniref:Protein LURP-one-related 15 n=1 Tax=Gracilariopsis chorda TaxID=448386 RepID=A0A2V3IW41_9FLOR|nr:hypothetical protein BWQ96_03851 [Gracilariopsis chorda]|eukprot:PXF46352.1 hypothetical protein BWQ96_03851 [Gracilariopsis chorda]
MYYRPLSRYHGLPFSPYAMPCMPYTVPYMPYQGYQGYPPSYPPSYPPYPYPSPYSPYYPHNPPPSSYRLPPYAAYASYPGAYRPPYPAQPQDPQTHAPQTPAQTPSAPYHSQQLYSASQLDAYGLPVVPGDLPVTYPETFRLEERLLGTIRGSFVARDQQGTLRYKVESKISVHERKVLKDMSGNVLLKLREARLTLRDRITLFTPTDIPILTLQKTSVVQMSEKRVHGYAGPQPGGTPILIITGNDDKTLFSVYNAQNHLMCSVQRETSSWKHMSTYKNMITGKDCYNVTVNYGSPALMLFIAVAIDEIYED